MMPLATPCHEERFLPAPAVLANHHGRKRAEQPANPDSYARQHIALGG